MMFYQIDDISEFEPKKPIRNQAGLVNRSQQ